MKTSAVYELKSDEYNTKLAEALKQIPEFKEPEWSFFVKSGVSRIKPPTDKDFWFKRAASILRQAYVKKIVGVNRLRTRYGSKKNRGMKPERFKKASGKIIRTILQQAEAAGLLEKYNVPGKRAGRKLTPKGKELMESIGKKEMNNSKENITEQKGEDNNNNNNNNKNKLISDKPLSNAEQIENKEDNQNIEEDNNENNKTGEEVK